MQHFRAPRWLPGGNLQTIWPALFSRTAPQPPPAYRRERWPTPDGDFVDVDFVDAADPAAPLLVLFHGLEGSSRSHYALAFAHRAAALGWAYAVPHFRGCSGEINLAPRAYHSGDHAEVGWMLERLREQTKAAHNLWDTWNRGRATMDQLTRALDECGTQSATLVARARDHARADLR